MDCDTCTTKGCGVPSVGEYNTVINCFENIANCSIHSCNTKSFIFMRHVRINIYVFLQTVTDTSSVEGYTISITPPPPTTPSTRNVTTTTLTLSQLADYTNYTFIVAAYNSGGVGQASLTRTVLTVEGGKKFIVSIL